ncbi:hypothetical protein C4569_01035 [Candidatus Parcubacteria bacterium]|nr:MAG: hypothetical protein C4569_01035 [Candidatus Parcubacteria bacterium]
MKRIKRLFGKNFLKRILNARELLMQEKWFQELDEKDKFRIAIQFLNTQRTAIQQLRFFLDILP